MDPDLVRAVWDALPQYAELDRPVSECMESMALLCRDHLPHDAWERLRGIDYDDLGALRTWIPDTLAKSPPRAPLAGLFLPLVQLADEESPQRGPTSSPLRCDIRFAGTSVDVAEDPELEWVNHQSYIPRRPYAGSRALLQISRVVQEIGPARLDLAARDRIARPGRQRWTWRWRWTGRCLSPSPCPQSGHS